MAEDGRHKYRNMLDVYDMLMSEVNDAQYLSYDNCILTMIIMIIEVGGDARYYNAIDDDDEFDDNDDDEDDENSNSNVHAVINFTLRLIQVYAICLKLNL